MIKRIWLVEPPPPDLHVFSHVDLPRMGLPILGTILKRRGYEVTILIPAGGPVRPAELAAGDLVGISITTSTAAAGYLLAERVRALAGEGRGPVIVFGGVHPTFLPDEALEHGDYVVRGEGEEAFPALVEALNGRGDLRAIRGLSYRDGNRVQHNPDGERIADLDSVPVADLSLIRNYRPKVYPIVASRGCPHNCTFCCVTRMMGQKYRFPSVERILSELRQVSMKHVFFYDDNFAAHPRRTKELLQKMIDENLGLTWSAQVRSDVAEDPELLALMRAAGGNTLYIGFESVNQAALTEFHKGLKVESVVKNIKIIKQHGFHIHGMFIFGADSDRPEILRETVAFAKRTGIDSVQFMTLTPLPGTPLYAKLTAEGRIITTDWRRYDGANVVFRPAGMSPYELQKLTFWALRRFYSLRSMLYYIWRREWARAGLVVYARHTINQWYNKHRGDFKRLRVFEGST